MKKNYTSPTIEKIAFRYRDQVVAASGDTPGTTPEVGQWNDEPSISGSCSLYAFEAYGANICNLL